MAPSRAATAMQSREADMFSGIIIATMLVRMVTAQREARKEESGPSRATIIRTTGPFIMVVLNFAPVLTLRTITTQPELSLIMTSLQWRQHYKGFSAHKPVRIFRLLLGRPCGIKTRMPTV